MQATSPPHYRFEEMRLMLTKLVLADFAQDELEDSQWISLSRVVSSIVRVSRAPEEIEREIGDADGLILRLGMSADEDLFRMAPKLRYIGMYGTGYGRINIDAAKKRGIVVTNLQGYSAQSVAEFCVGAAIGHLRDLGPQLANAVANHFVEPLIPGRTLASQSIGIIGMGHVGTRLASILTLGFGANVFYYSRRRKLALESDLLRWSNLADIMGGCDVISLHVNAIPGGEPILDSNLINRIKTGALLINSAPNEVVDLRAVETRLKAGTIAYIADHTDELQLADATQLSSLPGCYAYPPLGYFTDEALVSRRQMVVDNVRSFVLGNPVNVVS